MPIWAIIIVLIYTCTLLFVFSFSLAQLHLVYKYFYCKKPLEIDPYLLTDNNLPFVTIQLPIFNEKYVAERILVSISKINYPKNRFEIQVLDDSTDDTSEILENEISKLKFLGFDIIHIKRTNRQGFKAGALAAGLKKAKGDYIGVFDADFLPNPDFLLITLPYFQQEKIGMVQVPWLHINENYSFLTKLQAFGLDAHFTIDQIGRNNGGYFMNFNGTGGIWRKKCISESGGWSADCLTEDLDLSYRAQLIGWKFRFLPKIGNPAELPVEIQAVKSQQFRWAKGAAEVAKKLLFEILRRKDLSLATKIHSFFHLANSATYIGLVITSLLTIPVYFIRMNYPQISSYIVFAQYFQLSFIFLGIYFWSASREKHKNFIYFLTFYPRFLAFMMGISLHNSVGVMQGYFGIKSPFIRTPKFNINNQKDTWVGNKYVTTKVDFYLILEGIFCCYFIACLLYFIENQAFAMIPFFAMLVFGYISVFGFGVYHRFFGGK